MNTLVTFRASPVLRRAIKLRAALDDVDLQDVIIGLLESGLVAEINEVQERGLVEAPEKTDKPRKRGRKRKAGEDD